MGLPVFANAIPALQDALNEKQGQLTRSRDMKRTLEQAVSEDRTAAEAERAAKQQRETTRAALAAAWHTSTE